MSPDNVVLGPGLGESQRTIIGRLKHRGDATLEDLEGDVALARETLRGHLESLAARGLVERSGVRRGGPGRPHVLYRLTRFGEELFPRREGELLQEFVSFLLESGRRQSLVEFFEERARRKRDELQPRVAGLGRMERLEEVARILSEEGFVAEIEVTDEGPQVRLCHCPLRDLVAVTQLPCHAEMQLVEDLLAEPLRRETFMPDGGHTCSYSVGTSATSPLGSQATSAPVP